MAYVAITTRTALDVSVPYEDTNQIQDNFDAILSGDAPTAGALVINEAGADKDFRIEAVGVTHALFVEGSSGDVGIGTSTIPSSGLALGSSKFVTFNVGTTLESGLLWHNGTVNEGVIAYNASTHLMSFRTNGVTSMYLDSSGNVGLGGSAVRGTTAGTAHLDLFNGTAPTGTLANGVSFYSAAGEANVIDAAGNVTLLSPHDEDNNWIFRSKDTTTGKVLKIDMEKFMKFLNDKFKTDFVQEYMEAI